MTVAARLRSCAGAHPAAELVAIAHSFGTFLVGGAPNVAEISRFVFIGAHTGYFGDYLRRYRLPMTAMWHGVMPVLTRIVGHFPARALRLGEDIPRQLPCNGRGGERQSSVPSMPSTLRARVLGSNVITPSLVARSSSGSPTTRLPPWSKLPPACDVPRPSRFTRTYWPGRRRCKADRPFRLFQPARGGHALAAYRHVPPRPRRIAPGERAAVIVAAGNRKMRPERLRRRRH